MLLNTTYERRLLRPGDVGSLHGDIDHARASWAVSTDFGNDVRVAVLLEAENLRRIAVALCEHLNDLAPISRLPNEVLEAVFQQISNESDFEVMDIAKLTHVCHRWRHLALDSPRLWWMVSESRSCWTSTILKRSKSTPISILWNQVGRNRYISRLMLGLGELSRVQLINLFLDSNDFAKVAPSLVRPAPLLKSFALEPEGKYANSDQSDSEDTSEDGPTFDILMADRDILQHSHALECLSLLDVAFPWPQCAHRWMKLSTLEISFRNSCPDDRNRLSLHDILEIFTVMPMLEHVALRRALQRLRLPRRQRRMTASPHNGLRISMSSLQRLDLVVCDILSAHTLIRMLSLPPICDVDCWCGNERSTANHANEPEEDDNIDNTTPTETVSTSIFSHLLAQRVALDVVLGIPSRDDLDSRRWKDDYTSRCLFIEVWIPSGDSDGRTTRVRIGRLVIPAENLYYYTKELWVRILKGLSSLSNVACLARLALLGDLTDGYYGRRSVLPVFRCFTSIETLQMDSESSLEVVCRAVMKDTEDARNTHAQAGARILAETCRLLPTVENIDLLQGRWPWRTRPVRELADAIRAHPGCRDDLLAYLTDFIHHEAVPSPHFSDASDNEDVSSC